MWEIKSCNKNDVHYPYSLRNLPSAPDILYYIGDITICENKIIAVIGKRDAQERYLKIAYRIGDLLAQEGYTVLNGLAIGCDTYALKGAVASNGKVIAVMPGGLDEIYPKSNKKLAEKIIENGGCIISEYPTGSKPQKYTFVQRDKIQAMLSNKIFVVDSEKEGGTMHTVKYATKLNKPIGCFMENVEKKSPAGNDFLVASNMASSVCNTKELKDFLWQAEYVQMSMFA